MNMSKTISYALLPWALLAAGAACAGPAETGSHAQLCERIQQDATAWVNSDIGQLRNLTAPGFIHTDDNGRVLRREEWLHTASQQRHVDVMMTNVAIRNLGDTALVTGEDFIRNQDASGPSAEHVHFMQVWHRDHTGWREVASQVTPVFGHMSCNSGTPTTCTVQTTVAPPTIDPPRVRAHVGGMKSVDSACGFVDTELVAASGRH